MQIIECEQVVARELLYTLFDVDLANGTFTWKSPPPGHPRLLGTEAGSARPNRSKSYWVIKIGGKAFKRSRMIFLAVHGHWPSPCVDHINGNSLDDRIFNLREATVTENAWNHKGRARRQSLPMGVRLVAKSGRYQARISFNGRQIHLGAYDTPAEAQSIYIAKRRELFNEFA